MSWYNNLDLHNDWADKNHYLSDNKRLTDINDTNRIVFIGDSITEWWKTSHPDFFNLYINRGISGQITLQILERFKTDVLDLKPKVVVILGGINDLAGDLSEELIIENIIGMSEQAKQNNIKVVLCSILPANNFPWNPGIDPIQKIKYVNAKLNEYAINNNFIYVDYYSEMLDYETMGLIKEYTSDGIHLTSKGYSAMIKIINKVLLNI